MKTGKNYAMATLADVAAVGRDTLHDKLSLTSAEISVNELPAGAAVPFVHAHKRNEEIYLVLSGKGVVFLDGEELPVEAGSVIRVDPDAQRCFKADDQTPLRFLCVQALAHSLTQFTKTDGYLVEVKPSWVK